MTTRARWAALTALLGIGCALALRAAAPWLLVQWLEGAIVAAPHRLSVGDVDLELLRGGVSLERVELRRGTGGPVALRAERLSLQIAWRQLPRRHVRIESIEIDAPEVWLRRKSGGELELLEIFEDTDDRGESEGEAGEPTRVAWAVSVEPAALAENRIRLRDVSLVDPGRWAARLGEVVVRRASLPPGLFTRPGQIEVDAEVDGAFVAFRGELSSEGDARRFDAHLDVTGLPLGDAHLDLEGVDWSRVAAKVDGALDLAWSREGEVVSGSLHLRDLEIGVDAFDGPVLAWRDLSIDSARADLVTRDVSIGSLTLSGAALTVAPGPTVLPVLGAFAGEGESAGASTGSASLGWKVGVDALAIEGSRIEVREREHGPPELRVDVSARAEDVRAHALDEPFPLRFELGMDPDSRLVFDGRLAPHPWRAQGELRWSDVDLARLARTFLSGTPVSLETARSDGRLEVASGDGSRLAGSLTLREVRAAEVEQVENTLACVVAWQTLEVPVTEARVPWPRPPASGEPAAVVRLGRLQLAGPEVTLRYGVSGDGCAPLADDGSPDPGRGEGEAAAWMPALDVEAVDIADGRLVFLDRTVSPYVEIELAPLSLSAERIRSEPHLSIDRFEVRAQPNGGRRLALEGRVDGDEWKVDGKLKRVDLLRLNPYTSRHTPFVVRSGEASLVLKARTRKDRIDADVDLVLHDLELHSEDPDAFRERFGMPEAVAMSLLRDADGDIALDLPISHHPEKGTKLDVAELVFGALRRGTLNAMTAPLKLLGTVRVREGEVEAFEPEPVTFLPRQIVLTEEGEALVARLAEVLVRHPWLGVRIVPVRGSADVADVPDAGEDGPRVPATPEALSANRVAAVVARLVHRHGVGAERIDLTVEDASAGAPAPGRGRVDFSLVPLATLGERVRPVSPSSPSSGTRRPRSRAPG